MVYASAIYVYAIVGCIYWAWMLYGAVRTVGGVPVLSDERFYGSIRWPLLSIVIPACNEGEVLEPAIFTLLKQDYPDFELILIDDRSTDNTGAVVDRLAAQDARIRPLHITSLPEGWLGKVHALDQGATQARGDWILFTDADVHMAADTLRRAVAYAEAHTLDHLSALPDMWPTTWPVNIIVASFFRVFAAVTRCWEVSDMRSTAFLGIGAFNLVRRAAFEKTEGLAWLRLEVADDLGLGLLVKKSGCRSSVVSGRGLIGLHWYRNLREMAHGMEKAYASLAYCNPFRLLSQCVIGLAMEWAPVATFVIGWRSPVVLTGGVIMLALALAVTVVVSRWTRISVWPGLCFPIAVVISTALLLRSGWLGMLRGGAMRRGTLYTRKELDGGRRVRIP